MATATRPASTTLGNLTSAKLAGSLSHKAYTIRTAADVDPVHLQTLADAYLAKRTLAMVKGSVEMPGSHAVQSGNMVMLERVGTRFGGRTFVSEVNHTISGSAWKTQLTLSTDEQAFIGLITIDNLYLRFVALRLREKMF